MYALRKYFEPKTVEVKKIVSDMGKLGPLFKGNAGKIKELLEAMDAKNTGKITLTVDGKKIEIPKDCYKIVETTEKIFGDKFVPHVIEPSYGIDRILYCILEHNYSESKKKDEEYRSFTFKPQIAPIKIGVFPLVGNESLIKIAKIVDRNLRDACIPTYYDEGGTIGRRYARMDEIGTPFCVTIDHDSIKDKRVTVRDRDTTKQERIKIEELPAYIQKKISY